MGEGPLHTLPITFTTAQEVGTGLHFSEDRRLHTVGSDLSKVTQLIYHQGGC